MSAGPDLTQSGSGAWFDWGLAGAAELGRVCAVLVVVDVLSFTTTVEVAVGRGRRRALAAEPGVRLDDRTDRGDRGGERWPDGSLRPAVEDQLGAASVLDALSGVTGGLSVDAAVALAALASIPDVPAAIRGCVSGRELIDAGFAEDVEIAVRLDTSAVVPLLRQGVFTRA